MTAAGRKVEVYTTKSRLAYEIERDYFNIMFAYVAGEADPACPPQDPSSSPERIFKLFCRIAAADEAALSDEDRMIVQNHIQKLAEAALRFYADRRIDDATLRQIQIRLSTASHRDMQPLMLSAEIAESRLKPGDDKTAQGYPDNWERIVTDIALDEVVIVKDNCD